MMDKQKVYFPNLNGIRFFAAFLVIIHHIEQIKSIFKIDNYWDIPFVGVIGKLGVVLFFVLSGFLITYLLLAEEKAFQKISIRKFYVRRVLRIWPLYFLMIVLAFFVLPQIDLFVFPNYGKDEIFSNFFWKLFLYFIFFPNLVISLLGIVPYASHTWSIGTEEQFYLVWPILMNFFKKNRFILMFAIILSYLLFRIFLSSHFSDFIPYKKIVAAYWNSFNIDCMAIGGIYANLLFQQNKWLKILRNINLFYLTVGITVALLLFGFKFPFFHYEFYAVLFGLIILNFASNDKIKISLENKLLNYLGNISYGLYMYHPIGIVLALFICKKINLETNFITYPLSIAFTLLLAGLSYKYFESYFLKFKDKFSIIKSGNSLKF